MSRSSPAGLRLPGPPGVAIPGVSSFWGPMSTSVRFLVDGFNPYHSMREVRRKTGVECRWLDIRSLCESMLHTIGGGEIQNLLQQVGSLVYWSDRVPWMERVAR